MLVLSRRERERIRLGESIVVTIVRVSGDTVRLGLEAPAEELVLRDELDSQERPAAICQTDQSGQRHSHRCRQFGRPFGIRGP